MSLDTDRSITKILLLVCSLTLPASILLGGYLFYQRHQVARMKAELLSEAELQAEMLKSQPLDHALMPHRITEIGFVLNPFMKRSSFHAAEGDSYPVNSLGLRGPEITKKPLGVKRFLIVGDSVAFGWKLRESDRLSSVLNRRVAEDPVSAGKVEFVTIALPAWNVRSGVAFLESHLLLLDPDLVFWWSIYNDIEDVPGVIPPGILAAWASSQAAEDSPFIRVPNLSKRSGSFMPAVEDKRVENIELVAGLQSKHGIPVVLLGLPGLDERVRDPSFDPPWIHIPSVYRGDDRWKLSAEDSHPTRWANEIVALGILRRLRLMAMMPAVSLNEEDRRIVEEFDRDEDRRAGNRNWKPRDYSPQLAEIPTEYGKQDGRKSNSVLYGIGAGGAMARAGTLFLRDPGASSSIVLSFAPPAGISRYPGSARFSVRSRDREENQVDIVVDSRSMEVEVPVPATSDVSRVFELSWLFDYVLCRGPGVCDSATFLHAGFD